MSIVDLEYSEGGRGSSVIPRITDSADLMVYMV